MDSKTGGKTMKRRTFLKRSGGLLLPVAAGLPLVAASQQNSGVPKFGTLTARNRDLVVSYSLDPGNGDAPWARLKSGLNIAVRYDRLQVSGNTIYLSSARPASDGAQIPSDYREISITITDLSEDFMFGDIGSGRIRLSDGTNYDARFSNDGACFLTTACTAARGLPDDCMELQTLRAFRDGYMKTQASDGAAMIREYYQTAPAVVSAINALDDAAEIYDWMYRDLVVPSVRFIQHGQNARALDHYAGFFTLIRSTI